VWQPIVAAVAEVARLQIGIGRILAKSATCQSYLPLASPPGFVLLFGGKAVNILFQSHGLAGRQNN
jgi:hypothetical protein